MISVLYKIMVSDCLVTKGFLNTKKYFLETCKRSNVLIVCTKKNFVVDPRLINNVSSENSSFFQFFSSPASDGGRR